MIDKALIKKTFSKAASTYDESSEVQKETAIALAKLIKNIAARREPAIAARGAGLRGLGPCAESKLILDMGCGTGMLTGLIRKDFPGSTVYGCDIALPMIEKASLNLGDGGAIAADCEVLPFLDQTFGMVASSLAYQWADIDLSFREAARVLKPGGLFVFSTLGPKTLHEMRSLLGELSGHMEFKGESEIIEAIDASGLEPMEITHAPVVKTYKDIFGLVRTLKRIGAAPPLKQTGGSLSKGKVLIKAGKDYLKRYPSPFGGINATYDIILAAARKL